MKKIKRFWLILCNSGYEEPVYDNFKEELIEQNSRMVQTTSFIGSVMMSMLTFAAFFIPSVSNVMPLYFVSAITFIVIYLIARTLGKKHESVMLLCNYAFLTVAFFFSLGLDSIQRNPTATTVCVLLVALPLLIVDKPPREFLYFLVVTVCFMFESVYLKQSPKASIDILNGFSFFCVGTFLGYKHNQMVLRNIRGRHLLKQQRDMDTLTSLYNKGALELRARELLAQKDATAGIIIIDMDNFKFVNDTYGHHSGDELLIEIGKLLASLFRSTDLISRFGGDEFVVFLPMAHQREVLEMRAEQILTGISQIRITADAAYRAHACMGIASYPADGDDYEVLFKNADAAMYLVKKNGKNGYGFYDANLKPKILVVDDIEMNRAILTKTLRSDYAILEAADGNDALEVLQNNPDVVMVITDIQMPNMDGIALIKKIRSIRAFDDTAIIANTQYGDIEQENLLFKLGIDDFVYKAASPNVIQMRVNNVRKAREKH